MKPAQRQLLLAAAVVAAFMAGVIALVDYLSLGFFAKGASPQDRVAVLVLLWAAAAGLMLAVLNAGLRRYILPPRQMAEEARLLVADSTRRIKPRGSPELVALATAFNDLAGVRATLEADVAAQVREAQRSLAAEKNRLAALMSELHQSVVVCNLDGRILLYNHRARTELAGGEASGVELLGLGRSIYAIFDRGLIVHALDGLGQRLGREEAPTAQFLTAGQGGRLLRVHLAPVLSAEEGKAAGQSAATEIVGFVLILDDVTATFEDETRRDAVIHALTEGARGPLGSIRAAAETLADYSDMDAEQRRRFLAVIRDEAQALSQRLEQSGLTYADTLKTRWPLEEMRATDLVEAALRRISERVGIAAVRESVDESVWLKLDSFALLQALTYLAARLGDEYQVREVRLAVGPHNEQHARIDLIWSGTALSTETVMFWEMEPMRSAGEETPLTVRDVIARCMGEIWFERQRASHRAFFRILLPLASPHQPHLQELNRVRSGSRPEFYDFDLFGWSGSGHALDDRPLSELSYTVFDTETTGLEPSRGDEIIQIGATRIVNRRLLVHEGFERLIDPQRYLPPESVKIHGISAEMLQGQPKILEVLPGFHAYCADTVLVAHNAAFDMRFLQLKEKASGLVFDHPVIDTLLLSAVLHPNQESHRLEELAERFGVTIIGRHTAMGDAMVTAEVFLKMLPLLAEQGIHTLRQAREASEKTFYARISY